MKFKIEAKHFQAACNLSALVANPKSPVAENSCVRMKAENGKLYQSVVTSEMSIRHSVAVEVLEEGEAAVDLQLLLADIQSMSGIITVRTTKSNLMIEQGRAKRRKRLVSLDGFSKEPEVNGEKVEFETQELVQILNWVSFAVMSDASRPELRCVRVNDGIVMGGDGQRLSSYRINFPFTVSFPVEVVDSLRTVLATSEKATCAVDRWVGIETPNCVFKFSSLQGDYPDAAAELRGKLEATDPKAIFVVDRAKMLPILSSLVVYGDRARNYGVEYAALDMEDYPRLVAEVPDEGYFEDALPVKSYEGKISKILFHPGYLLQAFQQASGDVVIKAFGPFQPLLITDASNDNWALIQTTMATKEMVDEIEEEEEENDDF